MDLPYSLEARAMTPAKMAKDMGFKNLTEVSNMCGMSLQALDKWYKNRPDLFLIILLGCQKLKDQWENKK